MSHSTPWVVQLLPKFAIFWVLLLTAGCGKLDPTPSTVTAQGTITLDGQPLAGAAIVFVTTDGKYPASAQSDEFGNFSLRAFEHKSGAVPGAYLISVVKNEEITAKPDSSAARTASADGRVQLGVRNAIPDRYRIPSGNLKATIPEHGTTTLTIALTSDDA